MNVCAGLGRNGTVVWQSQHKNNSKEFCKSLAQVLQCPRGVRRVLLDSHHAHTASAARQFLRSKFIEPICLPERSPDLVLLGFGGWDAVDKMMGGHQNSGKKDWIRRLNRNANKLPRKMVWKLLKSFVRRIRAVHANKGGHIKE